MIEGMVIPPPPITVEIEPMFSEPASKRASAPPPAALRRDKSQVKVESELTAIAIYDYEARKILGLFVRRFE